MAFKTGGWGTLGRLLGEAIAIFVGVGAALAGQAWFEARTDRVAEREFLHRALEELATLEEAAVATHSAVEQNREVAVRLAILLSRPPTAARADSIAFLAPRLSRYFSTASFEAVDDLFGPENLRVVQDAALRSTLASARAAASRVRGAINQNRD